MLEIAPSLDSAQNEVFSVGTCGTGIVPLTDKWE